MFLEIYSWHLVFVPLDNDFWSIFLNIYFWFFLRFILCVFLFKIFCDFWHLFYVFRYIYWLYFSKFLLHFILDSSSDVFSICFLTIMFWSLITHCFYLLGIYFRFYWQLCFSVSWPFYVFCNLFFIFDVSFRCFLSLILFFNTFCFSLTTKKRKGEIQFICKYCEDND